MPVSLHITDDNFDQYVYYRYNAGGQRIYKKVGSQSAEHYIMDGNQNAAVFDEDGSLKYWNILVGGVVGRRDSSGARFYYIKDHLGSTRAVIDRNVNIVESHDYYPYGLLMPTRSYTTGEETKEKFTGKELDEETGWIHFPARQYLAHLGRWPVLDPRANDRPWESPYVYTGNNPVSRSDPDGEFWGAVIGAAVDFGLQVGTSMAQGQSFGEAVSNVNYTSVAISAGAGLLSGGLSSLAQGYKAGKAIVTVGNVAINVVEGQAKSLASGNGLSVTDAIVDAAIGVGAIALGDAVQGQVKKMLESQLSKTGEAGQALSKAEKKLAGGRSNSKTSRKTKQKNQSKVAEAQRKSNAANKKANTAQTLQNVGVDNASGAATSKTVTSLNNPRKKKE